MHILNKVRKSTYRDNVTTTPSVSAEIKNWFLLNRTVLPSPPGTKFSDGTTNVICTIYWTCFIFFSNWFKCLEISDSPQTFSYLSITNRYFEYFSLLTHHFTTFHAPKGIKIQITPNFLYDWFGEKPTKKGGCLLWINYIKKALQSKV